MISCCCSNGQGLFKLVGLCTAVGLAATSLLFTPAAPAAVITLGSTAAAGGITTAGKSLIGDRRFVNY